MAKHSQIVKELKRSLSSFDLEKAVELSNNEAKTRMYLVEPFFEMLGYNRGFENGNLVPEYDADFANLKGRKVDYAIQFRSKPEIIMEVKKAGTKLTDLNLRQLNEYFLNTNESKVGVLTNGVEYHFYCRNQNGGAGLHPSPFFSFDWENPEASLEQLSAFYSSSIEIKTIVDNAQEMFFMEGFEEGLFKELNDPSKEFIKAVYTRMGGARLTEGIESQIKELINSVSLKSTVDRLMLEEAKKANSGIITTEKELKVYHIVKTILAQHKKIDTQSIGYRDLKGKFSILIDDNQKKKVCDLYIREKSEQLEIDGVKFDISDVDSIVKLKKKLVDKALSYFN